MDWIRILGSGLTPSQIQVALFSPAQPRRAETRPSPLPPSRPGGHSHPPAHRLLRNRYPASPSRPTDCFAIDIPRRAIHLVPTKAGMLEEYPLTISWH